MEQSLAGAAFGAVRHPCKTARAECVFATTLAESGRSSDLRRLSRAKGSCKVALA